MWPLQIRYLFSQRDNKLYAGENPPPNCKADAQAPGASNGMNNRTLKPTEEMQAINSAPRP